MAAVQDDLPCQELVELVTDYLEGRLPAAERRRFEAHLSLCSGCRTYLEQMRQTLRALGRLPEDSIAPEAKERLAAGLGLTLVHSGLHWRGRVRMPPASGRLANPAASRSGAEHSRRAASASLTGSIGTT